MEKKQYATLRWKIIATTLSFSLVPLFALGFTIYEQFRVSYTAKIIETIRTLAENRRSAIDLFLDERVAQLKMLAHAGSFNELTELGVLEKVFYVMQAGSKSFVDLSIIDQEGNHVAYTGPYSELRLVNYKEEAWFHAVMLKGVYISDVFLGFRKYPHFIIAVTRLEGNRTWILRATIDTDIFESMVRAAQTGKGGDAFIVNRENVLQTTPRFSGKLLEKPAHVDFSSCVDTRVEELEINGRASLVATTSVARNKWVLVIREDPREELTPLLKARYTGISVFLAGLLVIASGTIFIAGRMTEHLIQADREKAVLDASLVESGKLAALGKLAAGVAHEINNPLAVIKEKAGWIKDLLADKDIAASKNFQEFQTSVQKIEQHVERARKVTHRLLGFARRMEPVRELVDVNNVIDQAIDFLENEARHRHIGIQTDWGDLPRTKSDVGQLQQVFLNLIDNGIDAIGKDGEINIRTEHHAKEKEIAVVISDTGKGIPKDMLKKIFEPFFTTKKEGSGTGLGLSISHSIIDKLGGRIVVESEEGHGSTFTVYLPIQLM